MFRIFSFVSGMGTVVVYSLLFTVFMETGTSAHESKGNPEIINVLHKPVESGMQSRYTSENIRLATNHSLVDRNQMQTLLTPNDTESIGKMASEKAFSYLEIEVSHSGHTFKLMGNYPSGKKEILYDCKIGLGAPEFPTPVGVYFVTHIYDEEPWWIPPKDRAWAAGDSPSKRVYGGTMAPLLKKKIIRQKKQSGAAEQEDMIESAVQLDDYGYRFHGTNQPRSIGQNQSHGCVRMLSADAKKVAAIIREQVGEAERKESENGSYFILKSPVRLNLIK